MRYKLVLEIGKPKECKNEDASVTAKDCGIDKGTVRKILHHYIKSPCSSIKTHIMCVLILLHGLSSVFSQLNSKP